MEDPRTANLPGQRDPGEANARTRRGFLSAVVVSLASALIVGLLWLIARRAPSAGRDPDLTPPAFAPTRSAPTPTLHGG